jgi:hypothetical protein
MPALLPLLLLLALTAASAQSIQRCQAPDGSVSYSNTECPAGTKAVKALAPAAQPTSEAQTAAQERVQRDKDLAKAIEQQRKQRAAQPTVPLEDARRTADCAYLRAELDASRRLRNVLTTRTYYSTEDVEQLDARMEQLVADYRRHCSR